MAIRFILLFVCMAIIIIVLLMDGKSNGFTAAISGRDNVSLFSNVKERGVDKTVNIIMAVLVVLFFALVIADKVVNA